MHNLANTILTFTKFILQLLWIFPKFTSKIFAKSPKEILPEMRIDWCSIFSKQIPTEESQSGIALILKQSLRRNLGFRLLWLRGETELTYERQSYIFSYNSKLEPYSQRNSIPFEKF